MSDEPDEMNAEDSAHIVKLVKYSTVLLRGDNSPVRLDSGHTRRQIFNRSSARGQLSCATGQWTYKKTDNFVELISLQPDDNVSVEMNHKPCDYYSFLYFLKYKIEKNENI